jgi:hypothetical protein
VGLLLGRSVRSALDIADWTNESQKGDALSRLLEAIATLAQLREQDLEQGPRYRGQRRLFGQERFQNRPARQDRHLPGPSALERIS